MVGKLPSLKNPGRFKNPPQPKQVKGNDQAREGEKKVLERF